MIRAALLLCLFSLAACGKAGVSAPFTQSRLPPGLEHRFWAPDGWAWGLIEIRGKPVMRYGVAAPRGETRADVIILPGYGESAEAWFETARALIEDDYSVWILEGAGQGGSGRYGATRDLGDAPDFEADIAAITALDRKVIRPPKSRPAVLIASGTAALPALAAVERGYRPAVLILSAPSFAKEAPRKGTWSRPATRLPPRQRAAASWAIANPDLRLGGASKRWEKARQALAEQVLAAPALALARTSVTVVAPALARTSVTVVAPQAGAAPCARLPSCTATVLAGNEAYPFAPDEVRDPWLAAVLGALPR